MAPVQNQTSLNSDIIINNLAFSVFQSEVYEDPDDVSSSLKF